MDNLHKSFEPMDIDLSAHSNNAMDISFNTSDLDNNSILRTDSPDVQTVQEEATASQFNNTQQSTLIKKFHINIQKDLNTYNSTRIKILCSALVLLLSIIAYQVHNIQCSNDINPVELKRSLSAKLYGQSRAISSLIEALSVEEKSKILFFYGGTGVGKTFTASLILEHIGHYSNVYHYTMPSFMDTFTTEFMIGLTVCKHSTVIVDDLSAKDMDVKTHIKDIIMKSQNLQKSIIIILIYNCDKTAKGFDKQCDKSFPNNLIETFKNIDAFKKLIKFEPLKEEHLRKCIENELGHRWVSDIDLTKFLKNFNVSLDGCKGVYSKIKFLEIS